jgi:hypothetical protein
MLLRFSAQLSIITAARDEEGNVLPSPGEIHGQ